MSMSADNPLWCLLLQWEDRDAYQSPSSGSDQEKGRRDSRARASLKECSIIPHQFVEGYSLHWGSRASTQERIICDQMALTEAQFKGEQISESLISQFSCHPYSSWVQRNAARVSTVTFRWAQRFSWAVWGWWRSSGQNVLLPCVTPRLTRSQATKVRLLEDLERFKFEIGKEELVKAASALDYQASRQLLSQKGSAAFWSFSHDQRRRLAR